MEEMDYEELEKSGEAISKLIADRKVFENVLEAYKSRDAPKFHKALIELKIEKYCVVICRLICRWVYLRFCRMVCRNYPLPSKFMDVEEMRKFGEIEAKLSKDRKTLDNLIEVYESQDVEKFQGLLKRLELTHFCVFICSRIRILICERDCRILCM